jgi:small-conductance mechanosensitive channel
MRTDLITSTTFPSSLARYSAIVAVVIVMTMVCDFRLRAQTSQPLSGADVLSHLNASITLYRDTTTYIQTMPSQDDLIIYEDDASNAASQASRLAFQSASAEAAIIGIAGTSAQTSKPIPEVTDYDQIEKRISARVGSLQSQILAIDKKLAASAGEPDKNLIEQRGALQSRLDSFKVLAGSLQNESDFIKTSNENTASLQGRIDDLARSVPEVVAPANAQVAGPKSSGAQTAVAKSSGLVGQALALYTNLRAMQSIDLLTADTARVGKLADALRQPLLHNMLTMIRSGAGVDNQSSASVPSPTAAVPQDPATLVAQVKSYSNALTSLNEEIATLNQGQSNLLAWHDVISQKSKYSFQSLLLHLAAITLGLACLVMLSKAWRALTLRFVSDAHRRRQSLIVRRTTIGLLMGIVLIVGFVSDFGSLATFAGFTTAGVAVGLNALFLSMAAYFFVIGSYGIRVGDRVTVSGITGEVVDIRLIRLYLMEMMGSAPDLYPTGRVVEFSNSVLFQASPVFKQIPGTDYTWHEVTLLVVPGGDYKLVQEKMSAVVNSVYAEYRGSIERQHSNIERRIEAKLKTPIPEAKAQSVEDGVEVVVRYPVEAGRVSEIDGRLIHAISELIVSENDLRSLVSGPPKIRVVARPAAG